MSILEAAGKKVAFDRAVECKNLRKTFARGRFGETIPSPSRFSFTAVYEQIHLAREARERRHYRATAVILYDELGNENRIREIRKWIIKALAGVHATERGEIGVGVFADEHGFEWRGSSIKTHGSEAADECVPRLRRRRRL